jgi:DeoR family transcriptional regulator of aga operon
MASKPRPAAARTNAALLKRSKQAVVLADSTKLGKVAFATICDLSKIDILITDADADPAQLDHLSSIGLDIRIV